MKYLRLSDVINKRGFIYLIALAGKRHGTRLGLALDKTKTQRNQERARLLLFASRKNSVPVKPF